ncbi:hypothetical protein [Nannocystis pusilla]|uniref:hypothetical protein n=1 Tax=Nannocystis pusilla TaxID=889268 RepID=UPI003B78E089
MNAGTDAVEDAWNETTGALEDTWHDATDVVEGGWNAALGALDPAALGNKILATGSGVIEGAQRTAKSAAGLIVRGVNELDALRKKVEGASRRAGTQAIGALVDSAETLAVEVSELTDTGMQWIEIIGTTIVDGAETAWRVVVNGVEEAFAAMEALVKRIAAEIREILEFLAYLFMWDDFLAASDEIHALLDDSFQQLRAKTPQLGEYKAQLADALRKGVEQAVGKRSVGDLFGLDIDAARPCSSRSSMCWKILGRARVRRRGVRPRRRRDLRPRRAQCGRAEHRERPHRQAARPHPGEHRARHADLAAPGPKRRARRRLVLAARRPVRRRGHPRRGRHRPRRQAVPRPHQGAGADRRDRGDHPRRPLLHGHAGRRAGRRDRRRADREVDEQGPGQDEGGDHDHAQVGVQPKSGQPQSSRDARRILWASMALGLVNSIVLTTKTALELAGKAAKQFSAILAATGGICTSLRGVLTLARLPSLPQKVRPYTGANAGLEIVTGAWTVLSAYVTYKVDDLWRPFDLVAFGLLGLATTTLSAVALGTGNLQGDSQIVTFSLRCGSWVSSSLMRLSEKYDDSDRSGRLKIVTVGLAVVSGVIDVAEAIYGNVDEVQQQVG